MSFFENLYSQGELKFEACQEAGLLFACKAE